MCVMPINRIVPVSLVGNELPAAVARFNMEQLDLQDR